MWMDTVKDTEKDATVKISSHKGQLSKRSNCLTKVGVSSNSGWRHPFLFKDGYDR